MTTPKIRALQALADATDRPFLASAPLMAIVEAVQVLDAAGLLAVVAANVPATDVIIAKYDAACARELLNDQGFRSSALEDQVHDLISEWDRARDEARRLRTELQLLRSVALESLIQLHDLADNIGDEHLGQNSRGLQYLYAAQSGFDALGVGGYAGARAEHCPGANTTQAPEVPLPCPDCGADDETHLGGCDDVAPAPERVPCPKCGVSLTPTGMCLNFPACPDALIPF